MTDRPLRPTPQPVPESGWESKLVRVQLFGLVLVGVAGLLGFEAWSFSRSATLVDGRVASWYRYDQPRRSLTTSSYLLASAPRPDLGRPVGREPVVEYMIGGRLYGVEVFNRSPGDEVPVLVPPDLPREGRVATPLSLYAGPLLVFFAGVVVIVGATVAARLIAADREATYANPPPPLGRFE